MSERKGRCEEVPTGEGSVVPFVKKSPVGGAEGTHGPRERAGASRTGASRRAGKLYRARSRLHRSQIFYLMLHVNMRLKALAEIYTLRSFALL